MIKTIGRIINYEETFLLALSRLSIIYIYIYISRPALSASHHRVSTKDEFGTRVPLFLTLKEGFIVFWLVVFFTQQWVKPRFASCNAWWESQFIRQIIEHTTDGTSLLGTCTTWHKHKPTNAHARTHARTYEVCLKSSKQHTEGRAIAEYFCCDSTLQLIIKLVKLIQISVSLLQKWEMCNKSKIWVRLRTLWRTYVCTWGCRLHQLHLCRAIRLPQ